MNPQRSQSRLSGCSSKRCSLRVRSELSVGTHSLIVEGRFLGKQLCLDLQKKSLDLAVGEEGVVTRVHRVFQAQIPCHNLNDQQLEFSDPVGDVYPAREEGKRWQKGSVNQRKGLGECCRPDL